MVYSIEQQVGSIEATASVF